MKMKKMWTTMLMAAFAAAACGAAELKIATVDLDKVFTAHPKTQAAEADLKKAEDAKPPADEPSTQTTGEHADFIAAMGDDNEGGAQ